MYIYPYMCIDYISEHVYIYIVYPYIYICKDCISVHV